MKKIQLISLLAAAASTEHINNSRALQPAETSPNCGRRYSLAWPSLNGRTRYTKETNNQSFIRTQMDMCYTKENI